MTLRFTLVTTFYPPQAFGGDAVHVHRLAEGLASRGHAVRVVHSTAAFRFLGGTEMAGFGPIDGVDVIDLDINPAELVGTYLTGGPLGYRSRMDAELTGADVVHFHNPSLLGGLRATRRPASLVAYTAHEHWLLCPMHTLFRNEREVCTTRTCVRCCAAYRRPPQPWRWSGLAERSVVGLDIVVCPSRFTADLHRVQFPDAFIEVVRPPGPSAAAIGHSPASLRPRPYVIFVGRLQPIKGALWMAEALRHQDAIDVVFVGDGPQRSHIEAIAGSSSRIHVLGQRPYGEVLSLAAGARALVIPSIGYESFGGVGKEAFSVGTPIVVRALGALPELVEHGGGVTFDSADELRAIVSRLAGDDAWREHLRSSIGPTDPAADDERFFAEHFAALARAAYRGGRVRLAEALDAA